MRKLIAVCLVAFSLSGCAALQNIQDVISIGTASVTNPVTPERLRQVEAGVSIVFTGLNTWKRSCVQGLINPNCKEQIMAVQVYTRKLPPYLVQLRTFVKNDDVVNASVVFNNITKLISAIKAQAAVSNVQIGS